MATGAKKPRVKSTREEKKAARGAKRAQRRETFSNLRQAFTLTRKNDPRFLPYLVIAAVLVAAVLYLVIFLVTDSPYFPIVPAIAGGLVAAMLVFSRRASLRGGGGALQRVH